MSSSVAVSARSPEPPLAAVAAATHPISVRVKAHWASQTDDPYRLPRLRILGGTDHHTLLDVIAGVRNDPAPPPKYPPRV